MRRDDQDLDLRDDARRLIGRAARLGAYVEVRLEAAWSFRCTARAAGPLQSRRERTFGGCVRVLHRGTWGFAAFDDLGDFDGALDAALELAALAPGGSACLAEVPVIEDHVGGPLPALDFALGARLVELCAAAQACAGVVDAQGRLEDRRRQVVFASTEGTCIRQDLFDASAALDMVARQGGPPARSTLSGGSNADHGFLDQLRAAVDRRAEATVGLSGAERVPSAPRDVVLDPSMCGLFVHEAFGHAVEADGLVGSQASADTVRVGRRVGAPLLHVVDDPGEPGERGRVVYDDEGVRAVPVPLVQEGVISGHLHSRETAARLGARPTGNARALDARNPPIVRMRRTRVLPGGSKLDELVGDVADGLYVADAAGGTTDGESFMFVPQLAWRIRDGRIAEPVRDVVLTGNLFHTLAGIDGVGRDAAHPERAGGCGKAGQGPLPVTAGGPHVRVRGVVAGS